MLDLAISLGLQVLALAAYLALIAATLRNQANARDERYTSQRWGSR